MYIKLEKITDHQSGIIIINFLSIWTNTFIDFLKFWKVLRTVSIFTLKQGYPNKGKSPTLGQF